MEYNLTSSLMFWGYVLTVSEIYHKYIDQDPVRVFQYGALKSALIIFAFLATTLYLDLNRNLIIMMILFMANLSGSILMGSIQSKKKAFFYYIIIAIFIVNISPYVHTLFAQDGMYLLPIVFALFLLRGLGEAFMVFPIMLLVMVCVCFVRFPLDIANQLDFTITAILISGVFYLVIVGRYKYMKTDDIRDVLLDIAGLFVKNYISTFDKAKNKKITRADILRVRNNKFNSITSLHKQVSMFLKSNQLEDWRYFYHNFVLFNRLIVRFILNYKKMINNHEMMGYEDIEELEHINEMLENMFKKTIQLIFYALSDDVKMLSYKVNEVEQLKHKFEMAYVEKYQKDTKKRKTLFDAVLLLDDMLVGLDNLKEAYGDLKK